MDNVKDYDRTIDLLKRAGFNYICTYPRQETLVCAFMDEQQAFEYVAENPEKIVRLIESEIDDEI